LKTKREKEHKDRMPGIEKELPKKKKKLRELSKMKGEANKLQREKLEMKDIIKSFP
jgi:hypothetical protein